VIYDLRKSVEKHEVGIANQTKSGLDALDIAMAKTHVTFRTRIEIQRRIYATLKKDFFKSLSKYM